ncbi:uncharacterized protein LOC143853239 [Tasmannia lanceolata]|uniref:uncharacterized protein LOC143853239 n=1 Tax=Tasmannia lanceolata TaxID=3420 RepID=UPI0040637654
MAGLDHPKVWAVPYLLKNTGLYSVNTCPKEWDKEQKEVDQGRKRILEDRLMEINTLAESGLASAEDYEQQGRLIQEHKELLMLKEISWRQRSRVKWLLEGDKNTAFFHAMASARRRRNRIESLEVEGEIVSDKERIIEEIIEFYRSLYSADGMLRPIPQDICFASLSLEASAGLEIPFSEVEIRSALFSLAKDKAPGPDANEAIDYYRRKGEGGILCKLDMEEAYDRVDWAALDFLMGRMGFGDC